jgi:hypothetical protein
MKLVNMLLLRGCTAMRTLRLVGKVPDAFEVSDSLDNSGVEVDSFIVVMLLVTSHVVEVFLFLH